MPTSDLFLLIPGLLGPLPNIGPKLVRLPRLEKILSRADRFTAPGDDLSSTLFGLFGQPLPADRDLPVGALNYLGDGGEPGDSCWLRADPVHLRPDRDRLLLFGAEQLEIQDGEAVTIASQFNAHFAPDGMRLLTPHRERWYLQLEHTSKLNTQPLHRVAGRHIEAFMPQGEDAGLWRQRLNEMQMLLFQSPVNQQREADGRVTINGIWISGNGCLPVQTSATFDRLFGNDPTLRGLARLQGLAVEPIPADYASLWGDGAALVVLTDLLAPLLNADPQGWIEAIHVLESRLDALLKEIHRGEGKRLQILPGNGLRFMVTAATLRRFWRRRSSLFDL